MLTVFDNDMNCLFCEGPVTEAPNHAGYRCDHDQDGCGAYYYVSGVAQSETVPQWYAPDGNVQIIQEHNNGVIWHWCPFHRNYEPDTSFPPRPCPAKIIDMTTRLSG